VEASRSRGMLTHQLYMNKILSHRCTSRMNSRLSTVVAISLLCWLGPVTVLGSPSITYVQGNYATPQGPETNVTVTFTAAQAAGDLNVIAVGWNDSTATIAAVTDNSGNIYTLAVGPAVQSGYATQSIYYARNIVAAGAGANSVTVTFSPAAISPDIRILEYSGADPNNPVDVTAAASGSSATGNSGSVTTTNATDLLFAANLVQGTTTAPGSGFTSRLLTQPDGDIAEDRMVTATGSYSATAPVTPSSPWVMQMVAFRTPSSGGTTPPTVSSVSPNSGSTAGGTAVTITGTNFSAGATVTFGMTAATSVVVVSPTSITAITPAGSAGAATVMVMNPGAQSGSLANGFTYIAAATAITYVQGNYATPQGPESSVTATFRAAQVVGDINVIAVGWNDSTASVSAVTDNSGNIYTLAVGPTVQSGYGTQSIYYARNIVAAGAGANSVTVTFSPAAISPDIRILEYRGSDPNNPVDVTIANSGNSATSSSGPVTTTNATDLLFAANLVQSTTTGAGSGFTSRILTQPDSDIVEDTMVTVTGSYSATAPITPANPWIMQMVAFRTPSSGGTTPPTAPGNLTAAAVSTTQINLSWAASTTTVGLANYIVQRCQGAGCSNFTQIATTPGTAYNNTGLTSGNSYSYRVRAVDTAGNTSTFSNIATAVAQSPQPPTAPGNLTAMAASASQINLSWIASTSNVGIAYYAVRRCQGPGCTNFAQIGTSAGTTYNDTGLTASSSYSYQVQAVDSSGNASTFSNSAAATTQASQAPTAPSNLTAIAAGTSQINLSWIASTSNVGIAYYAVWRCQGAGCTNFVQIAAQAGTTYSDTGLTASSSYSYQVQAVDKTGNLSPYSSVASATTWYLLPLKASPNNLYTVDQNETPFLIMGDSPQSMVGNLSPSDMATYMADRERLGFNAIWVNLLCASYTFCNSNGTTYDGVAPFTSGSGPSSYSLATPNSTYFSRVDAMVNLAANYNLVVFLDPVETGGWLVTLENNGSAGAFNYGVYIGNRYKNFANIVWLHGNDFQDWSSSGTDNNLVQQVMAGIASVDSNHLQTIELNYNVSYSSQDSTLGSFLTLDSAYTYYETYDSVLQSYNSAPTIPTYLVEANYEYENNTGALPGPAGTYVLREQAYWTILSGGTGQIYGNHYIATFTAGWQSFLDSPGALEIQYVNQLLGSVPWWNLVPDTAHRVVTGGYGTYNGSNLDLAAATYCTTSRTTSGSLALTYCPSGSTLTVNLSEFSGPVTAQWYDPSNGTYTTVAGSTYPNSGTQSFTTPGNNHDGAPDWVLVLHI